METIFSEKATSLYVKFDNRDDFSKISIGADFSREIGPRGRFLQGLISPAFLVTNQIIENLTWTYFEYKNCHMTFLENALDVNIYKLCKLTYGIEINHRSKIFCEGVSPDRKSLRLFMLPEGRSYYRRFVCPSSFHPSAHPSEGISPQLLDQIG